ncbi:MAG: sigma-70 family RNA polymerase sigma factor [Gemmatimonadota bacterium]
MSQVVKTYLGQIFRAARGAGFDASRAEDVAQATFATFLETVDRFEGRSSVRTWLFGILHRKIHEARRIDQRHDSDDIDEVFESRFDSDGSWQRPPSTPEMDLEADATLLAISDCLDGAPEQQQAVFKLRDVQGMTTAEICNILAVSRTNLGVLLHRVRNRLRECLEAKGIAP